MACRVKHGARSLLLCNSPASSVLLSWSFLQLLCRVLFHLLCNCTGFCLVRLHAFDFRSCRVQLASFFGFPVSHSHTHPQAKTSREEEDEELAALQREQNMPIEEIMRGLEQGLSPSFVCFLFVL